MKKLIRLIAISLTLVLISGFAISNYIRPLSNPSINDIDIVCFDHSSNIDEAAREAYLLKIEQLDGVKSAQVNAKNMVVTIDMRITDRNTLAESMKTALPVETSIRSYAESDKPQCPVTGADSYPQKIAQIFRF